MNVFISVLDTQMLTGKLCISFVSNVTCRMVLSYGLILVKFKNKTISSTDNWTSVQPSDITCVTHPSQTYHNLTYIPNIIWKKSTAVFYSGVHARTA